MEGSTLSMNPLRNCTRSRLIGLAREEGAPSGTQGVVPSLSCLPSGGVCTYPDFCTCPVLVNRGSIRYLLRSPPPNRSFIRSLYLQNNIFHGTQLNANEMELNSA